MPEALDKGTPVRRMPDLCSGLFSIVLSLRESDDFGDEDALRNRIRSVLAQLDRDGIASQLPAAYLQEIKYPLVVFIDETILRSKWEHVDKWRERPLQALLYGSMDGGVQFFQRLEKLRKEGSSRADLIELYYHCVALGFQGQYALSGKDRLHQLMGELRGELTSAFGTSELSPHAAPRDNLESAPLPPLPTWRLAFISGAVVVLLFLVLTVLITSIAGDAVSELQRYVQ